MLSFYKLNQKLPQFYLCIPVFLYDIQRVHTRFNAIIESWLFHSGIASKN